MSRIGNKPVAIPSGVTVDKIDGGVRVKGPKGTLTEQLPESIAVEIEGGQVVFRRSEDSGPARALHGLVRALVANMVKGVVTPFAMASITGSSVLTWICQPSGTNRGANPVRASSAALGSRMPAVAKFSDVG